MVTMSVLCIQEVTTPADWPTSWFRSHAGVGANCLELVG